MKRFAFVTVGAALIVLLGPPGGGAGLLDDAKSFLEGSTGAGKTGEDALSPDVVNAGLIEALETGARNAVEKASAEGGFLDNPAIRIPLPEKLGLAGETLRRFGMGAYVDDVETTMNRAAEKAAAEALPVFADAIKELTFEDVKAIWKGGDTAATDYFRGKTWDGLYGRMKPVVHDTAASVGVTRAYQAMTERPMVSNLVAGTSLDLDHYVTQGALGGLFTLLGDEEKKIRTDPVARTTDLLKQVFGD